jgi:hypothetical protein
MLTIGCDFASADKLPRFLKHLAVRCLPREQECLRVPAFAAEHEGAEVLVPATQRNLWPGFDPNAEAVQIVDADARIR